MRKSWGIGRWLLLFSVSLICASANGQSLTAIGENNAFGVGIGYVSNSMRSGPTVSMGVSIAKALEIGVAYASLDVHGKPVSSSDLSKPASLSVSVFPLSAKNSGGIGIVGAVSKDFENRTSSALSLGAVFYLSIIDPESPKNYFLTGVGVFHNTVLGFTNTDRTFETVSFDFEFGWLSEHKASPFITFSVATAEDADANAVAASVGIRFPIPTKKTSKH